MQPDAYSNNVLTHFLAHTDSVGISIAFVLLFMSILTWTVLVYKSYDLWKTRQHIRELGELTSDSNVLHIGQLPKGSVFYTYFALCILRPNLCFDASSYAMTCCVKRLQTGQTLLATIASMAPYLGLLGTVWGIYHALLRMGEKQLGLDAMIGAVGEALIMTALGLVVAIPASIAYNFIQRGVNQVLAHLHAFSTTVNNLQKNN